MKETVLPEAILRAMWPEDRLTLGRAGQTSEEAQAKSARREEGKIHKEISNWLSLHRDELYFDHSAMNRRTTNRPGHPDYTVIRKGEVCLLEIKAPGCKPSPVQQEVHSWLNKTGTTVWVVFSSAEAIKTVRRELRLDETSTQ